MNSSDMLLLDRKEVNRLLHLTRCLSFSVLKSSSVAGKVMMADVRALLRRSAVGTSDDSVYGLLDVNSIIQITGMSRKQAHRIIDRNPHYRITNKTKLISTTELYKALKKGKQNGKER